MQMLNRFLPLKFLLLLKKIAQKASKSDGAEKV